MPKKGTGNGYNYIENWYALLECILRRTTCTEALRKRGIVSGKERDKEEEDVSNEQRKKAE